jgi:NAD+ diphosphatase
MPTNTSTISLPPNHSGLTTKRKDLMWMSNKCLYKRHIPSVKSSGKGDEEAYLFVFCDNMLLVHLEEGSPGVPLTKECKLDITPIRKLYLGTLMGEPCYAVEGAADSQCPEGLEFKELRSLYGLVEEDIYALAGRAKQILLWDQNHQFCGRCGTKTKTLAAERAKVCPQCGLTRYPHISPVVIAAILKGEQILIVHSDQYGKMASLIAGFVEAGETLEETMQREIMEEVDIKVKNIRYFSSQSWPFPDCLMIGFIAEYDEGELVSDGVEVSYAGWFDVQNLQMLELPPKATLGREMIDWYIKTYSI